MLRFVAFRIWSVIDESTEFGTRVARHLRDETAIDTPRNPRHNCGVTAEPLRAVRDHLSEIVDRVEREHERVVITRNGRDAAVLLSPADLAELEETLSVLSDPQALADIREADAAYSQGDVIRGIDAVRALRP